MVFNIKCYGTESSIHGCQYDTIGTCSNAVGVMCSLSELWSEKAIEKIYQLMIDLFIYKQ